MGMATGIKILKSLIILAVVVVCCVEGANGTHFIITFGRVVRTGLLSMVFDTIESYMVPSLVAFSTVKS
jgi:hypothetical protein